MMIQSNVGKQERLQICRQECRRAMLTDLTYQIGPWCRIFDLQTAEESFWELKLSQSMFQKTNWIL